MADILDLERVRSQGEPQNVADVASKWVSHLAMGAATPEEVLEVKGWLAAHPDHQAAFDRARLAWAVLQPFNPTRKRWYRSGRFAVASLVSAAAACIAVVALNMPLAHDFSAPVGEIREVTLADGSRLWLDTGAAADFSMTPSGRTLKVAKGRIHIDVAAHSAPLTVAAEGFAIRDIGTVFSVDTDGEGLQVSVSDGAVEVSRNDETTALTAGQSGAFVAGKANAVEPFNAASESLWRSGRIVLNEATLADAFHQIERYRRGKVLLLDADIADRAVSGTIALDDMERGIDAVAAVHRLRVVRLPLLLLVLRADE